MTELSESVDWRDFREFAGVDLTASFVLSWHVESETLVVDVDIVLLAEHPFFERPRPKEKVCIRPAVIEFAYCESVSVNEQAGETIASAVEQLGHGPIDNLRLLDDGRYELSGEFGSVVVESERPVLRLKGP